MKTIDEIYNELQRDDNINELNNELKEIKAQNKKIKIITIVIMLIVNCLILFILVKYNSITFLPIILVFNVVIVGIIFTIITLRKKQREFIGKYKDLIIKKIISNFYDNLEYFPEKQMPEYIYKQARYEHYDRYLSNDYLEAQIDEKYSIQMADVLTKEIREYEDNEGEKRKEEITMFDGIFAKIAMDKSINTELRIMQDKEFRFDKNRINMDSGEFEKYFDVKSSNQIITMQILTADVMEELVEFENNTKIKYDIYINNNDLYLRIHFGTLNVRIEEMKTGVLYKKILEKYFKMINFTYNLSKKLIETINNTEI